jgi:hypothetical protein
VLVLVDEALVPQRGEQAVRRRAGQLGAACDLRDREALLARRRDEPQECRRARHRLRTGDGSSSGLHDVDSTRRGIHMASADVRGVGTAEDGGDTR